MATEFIAMLHYSQDHAAWLALTGWDAQPLQRDAIAALRQIEQQTDAVIAERGEPEHTPYLLIAGSIASERAPHLVRKTWRLAPELADRLLSQIEQRGTDEAIDEALTEWESEQARHGEDVDSLDFDDYVGVDFEALARRAYPAT